jgi:hypothetical protein
MALILAVTVAIFVALISDIAAAGSMIMAIAAAIALAQKVKTLDE